MSTKQNHDPSHALGQAKALGQIFRFAIVGGTATLLHLATYLGLIHFEFLPQFANLCAFMLSFCVSAFGHFQWTFQSNQSDVWPSTLRFFTISILGLASNSFFTWLIVSVAQQSANWAVIAYICITPPLTFLASKFWAFRPQQGTSRNHMH